MYLQTFSGIDYEIIMIQAVDNDTFLLSLRSTDEGKKEEKNSEKILLWRFIEKRKAEITDTTKSVFGKMLERSIIQRLAGPE